MFKKIVMILKSPIDIWQMFITYLPGELGVKLRYRFWKRRLKFLGNRVRIDVGVYFQNPQFISIDDNCWIDKNVVILAGLDYSDREKVTKKNDKYPGLPGELFIGKNVHISIGCILSAISSGIYISNNCAISANSKIYAFNSHYRSEKTPCNQNYTFTILAEYSRQCIVEGPIFLDESVGVALNSIILPGVFIEKNSFIAINSVVFSSFPENSLIAGSPAKRVRDRFESVS